MPPCLIGRGPNSADGGGGGSGGGGGGDGGSSGSSSGGGGKWSSRWSRLLLIALVLVAVYLYSNDLSPVPELRKALADLRSGAQH